MINAGARHLGPFTPAEAVQTSVKRSPDQVWGHVVVFSQWGRVLGWSELAIHALPWLIGLLTLAWVYRIGRALFTARIALAAMLLLSTSVVFLTYMHKARSYGLAMFFAAIVLWAYWRVALHPRLPGRATGPSWCWARQGCSTLITSARCCCRRWRSSTCSSCARNAAGGSR